MKIKLCLFLAICAWSPSIMFGQVPTFPVIYPSTGNIIGNGLLLPISWTPPTNVANVRITVLTNDSNGILVHPSAPNSGMYYGWQTPYVVNVTNQWRISISGCTPQNVCGETTGGYFTFVSLPPARPTMTIRKVGQNIHIECIGSCGFNNYIQGSTNLIVWHDLSGPFVGYGGGGFSFSAILPYAIGSNMFFRAVTRY